MYSDSKEVDGVAEQDQRVLVCGGCVGVYMCVVCRLKTKIKGNTVFGNYRLLYNTNNSKNTI